MRTVNLTFSAVLAAGLVTLVAIVSYVVWNQHAASTVSGTVTDHRYVPASVATDCVPGTNPVNRPRCTTRSMSESYQLKIEQPGWDVWVVTTAHTFVVCQEGDYWDADALEGCRTE